MNNVWITVFSSVISGVLGVAISTWYYRRYENRKYKLESLKRFMGNRYDLTGDDFSRALNEIFVVYEDSPEVMTALSCYHESINSPKDSEDDMILLFKAMCKDVGIKYEKFNDSFFLRPFNTRPNSTLKPYKVVKTARKKTRARLAAACMVVLAFYCGINFKKTNHLEL